MQLWGLDVEPLKRSIPRGTEIAITAIHRHLFDEVAVDKALGLGGGAL